MSVIPQNGRQDRPVACVFLTSSAEDFESAVAVSGTATRLYYAASVRQATQQLTQTRARVLLVSDTIDEGSWEVAREGVRDLDPPVAVIVVAAYANENLWIDVLERGAFDLLQRPFWAKELAYVVENADAHARRRQIRLVRGASRAARG